LVGYPQNASNEYFKKTERGGSGLREDLLDPPSNGKGFVTIFVCFFDEHKSHGEEMKSKRPLK